MPAPRRPRSLPARARRGLSAALAATLGAGLLTALAPVPTAVAAVPSCATAGLSVTSLGGPNFYIDDGSTPKFTSGYTGYEVTNVGGAALQDVWVRLSDFTGGALGLASGQPAAQRLGDLSAGTADTLFWYLTASRLSASAQQHTVTLYDHDPSLATSTPICATTGGFASVAGTIAASANKVTSVSVGGAAPKLGARFTVTVSGDTGTIGAGIAGDPESLWMTPAVATTWPAHAFRLVGTSLSISPDGTAAPQVHTDILRLADLGGKARAYTATYTFQAVGFTSGPTAVMPVQEIASGTQVKHTGTYPASIPPIQAPVNDLTLTTSTSTSTLPTGGGRVAYAVTVTGQPGASLDSFVVTPPSGATPVPGSSTWGGAPAPDPVLRSGTLVVPGPFTVPPSGTAELTFSLDLDATPGPRTVAVLGAVGDSLVGEVTAPIDGSRPASATVTVNRAPTAAPLEAWTDVDTDVVVPLAPGAADVDGDPLAFATAAPTAAHGTVSVVAGELTYAPDAGYSGDDTLGWSVSDGRGGSASSTLTVHVAARDPQVIDFPAPSPMTTPTLALDGGTDSGLPVTWAGLTPQTCTVDDHGVVTAVAAGTCTVRATQPGDGEHAPAAPVTRSFTVEPAAVGGGTPPPPPPASPADQVVTLVAPTTLLAGPDPVVLEATSTSGLPVTLGLVSGDCVLDGEELVATVATVCTVRATQAGSASYAAAPPVERTTTFVLPVDDASSMAAPAPGATSVTVDVLDNDPAGLTVVAVDQPGHGTTALEGGRPVYTPSPTFRGSDSFGYLVRDASGRTAGATVTVTVANALPELAGAQVRQLAGSTLRVPLSPSDANGDPLVLAATTTTTGVRVAVEGTTLVVVPGATVSGWVEVVVTAADGTGTTSAVVRDLVVPAPVASATRTLTATGTTVRWTPSPATGARYEVRVDGRPLCVTTALSCATDRVLGPLLRVSVRVLGRDGTVSERRLAGVSGDRQVLVATVRFGSDESRLTRGQRARLDRVIDRIHALGFARAYVSGYTDSDGGAAYNLRLSQRRTRTVSAVLRAEGGIGSRQEWFGFDRPVADNQTSRGRAANRRVEILVGFDG